MPIRIDYSPVGTLLNLARSAGEAQGARESAAKDLAFTQMAMQAQTQNAQIAASMRRNDQAFQLQQAAQARQSRTPTRAQPVASPLADQILHRQTVAREWEQQGMDAQMQQLSMIPGLSDRERESIKLGIMGGQSIAQLLKERYVRPEQMELTFAQREARLRITHQNKRDVLESRLRSLDEERQLVGWTPEKDDWQKRYDTATKAIETLDVTYGAMQPAGDAPAASGLNLEVLNTPRPPPASKADLVPGQVYIRNDGKIRRWTGTGMVRLGK